MKRVIGVTGNIASGKSILCKFFEELGAEWIDADKIGHKILEENKEKIKEIFGKYLSRKEIAEIIFNDEKLKIKYERWIHGEITKEIRKLINKSKEKYIFIEGALIYEAQADKLMDFVIYVKSDEEKIMERAKKKGIEEEKVKKILYFQNRYENKEKKADLVVENNGTMEELKKKAEEIFEKIKKLKPKFVSDHTCLREIRWLRLLGFDSIFVRNLRKIKEAIYFHKRYFLTRKKGYLFPEWKIFYVPEGPFNLRMKRIIEHFELKDKIEIFKRCSICNGEIEKIEKEKVRYRVPYYTYKTQENFYICRNCDKIYWEGSHKYYFEKHIKNLVE